MQCNAMQCNAMQYNAMQCNAMQCNAMQCNAVQYNVSCNFYFTALNCSTQSRFTSLNFPSHYTRGEKSCWRFMASQDEVRLECLCIYIILNVIYNSTGSDWSVAGYLVQT